MPKLLERRRKPRRKAVHVTGPAWVMLESVPGARADVRAKVVDFNETGMRIHVSLLLQPNHVVVVKCQGVGVVPNGKANARVVDCRALMGSGYTVGLTFEEAGEGDEPDKTPALDHYEILQVSSKADPETIHRVYRLQAQRFHPDNGETGHAETFRAIAEAYKILGDPERRAAYDVHLESYRKFRWRIFDRSEAAMGKAAERSKRRGVLELLYTARRSQPGQATVSIHELEELLGCPREHLDFSLWYLKENALISTSANGRYSITAKGVDHLEAEEAGRSPRKHLLAAAE
jgi:hypothetical protein